MPDTCTADSGTCATCGRSGGYLSINGEERQWYHHDRRYDANHPLVPRPCGAALVIESVDDLGYPSHRVSSCERGHTAEATA